MQAAQINSYGDPGVLQTVNDAPKPEPGEGQVLVEVYAAGVNPWDWKVRQGNVKDSIKLNFPATLGGDLAGVVAEVGPGVSEFSVGDEVYGTANSVSGQGSFAEFAPASVETLSLKPKGIDFVTAAALPLAAVSAYQAIVDELQLQSGQKVLIHGGVGGIGALAVQIAKHLGALVATTVATEDIEYAKTLGADEIIDYTTQDFTAVIHDYDAVFDTVGGDTARRSYAVLKPGGKLVSMVENTHEDLVKQYSVAGTLQSSKTTPGRLQAITELVENGALKVRIDKVFPLEQAGEALGYLQHSHTHGKVVIAVKS